MVQNNELGRLPSISIAIPNLNQGQFLEEAIQSILNHRNLDIRIAVLDAGSTDNSKDIIEKYKKHIYYVRSYKDNGQAAAINEGINHLPVADFVCWLNADDVFLANGLNVLANFLVENPECNVAYGNAYITNEKNETIGEYPTERFSTTKLARSCIICQPASLIRYHAWKAVGGLVDTFQMCMDYDLWWRLKRNGDFGYVGHFVACSRDHGSTKTRKFHGKHMEESFAILRENLGYVPWIWCATYVKEKHNYKKNFFNKVYFRLLTFFFFVRNLKLHF